MRYWDSSALIPLLVQEEGSELVDNWLRADDRICTWGLTRVELASAVERRAREGVLNAKQRREALRLVGRLAAASTEVIELEAVQKAALSLLARHPLRAADALQLGAAKVVVEAGLQGLPFVSLDRRLAEAAEREGFEVLSWED